MSRFGRVLLPIDFSQISRSAIAIATQLAKQNNAKLCFVHVAPATSASGRDDAESALEETRSELEKFRPDDDSVSFEHVLLQGNAGSAIARLTKTADLCVMSALGMSGDTRMAVGSVAQHVLQQARCPVVVVKGFDETRPTGTATQETSSEITCVMRPAVPIREFETMTDVVKQFEQVDDNAAPVVDSVNRCIGILTSTDVEKYLDLRARLDAGDESVVHEAFQVDKYRHVRTCSHDFDQVRRHMTTDVISIDSRERILDAIAIFQKHPQIHHLVVLDENDHPVGMVHAPDIVEFSVSN